MRGIARRREVARGAAAARRGERAMRAQKIAVREWQKPARAMKSFFVFRYELLV